MMIKARGPVWHTKQKSQGIIPRGLTGIDKDATWGKSQADGWVYGHGTFCLTPHRKPIVGIFQWMPNSANEAKRMQQEIIRQRRYVQKVFMDSKADSQKLYNTLKHDHGIQLVTVPRKGMNKSESRKKMIQDMLTPENKKEYAQRSVTVEPMQGLIAEIFELQHCWMRSQRSNRWCFAAIGIAMQIAQNKAFKNNTSTWAVKNDVLGI